MKDKDQPAATHKCPECGKRLPPAPIRYCSQGCAEQNRGEGQQPPAPDVVHVCSECGSLLAPGGDGIDYCWRCRVAPLRRSLRPAAPEVVYRTGDQWPGELIPIFQENDLSVFRELAAWKYTVTITREEKDHE